MSYEITVQCSGTTVDGTQCERTMRVHAYFKFWDHYCALHGDYRE